MRRGTGAGRALIHLSPCGRGRRAEGAAGEGLLRGAFHTPSFVMPGLDPGIPIRRAQCLISEMAGTSPAMTSERSVGKAAKPRAHV